MSLFEIDINDNFKILDSEVFFDLEKFKKFYKLNNLNQFNKVLEDIKPYIFQINYKKFAIINIEYDEEYTFQEIVKIIESNIYEENIDSNEYSLYPEWLLFYIIYTQISNNKNSFIKYIPVFKYISEIRYKTYIIKTIQFFVPCSDNDERKKLIKQTGKIYDEYLLNTQYETNYLFEFLEFLYEFYTQLKKRENYKLMWNLEVYIIDTINLLIDQKFTLEDIYKKIGGLTYSRLHNIHRHQPLYIKESVEHYSDRDFLPYLQKVFQDATRDSLSQYLLNDEKYQIIIISYYESIRRLNADNILEQEIVLGALIRNMVLELEEIIKKHFNEIKLKKCIESLFIDQENKEKLKDNDLETSGEEKLNKIKEYISLPERLDKYLLIYYRIRNYSAHNSLIMNELFRQDNKKIVKYVTTAIIIILYQIQIMKVI